MRFFLIMLFIILFVIITLPVLPILLLMRKKDVKRAERGAHFWMSWLMRVVACLASVRLTVRGLENVPTDEPVLYISNHRSFFDIILTYPRCFLPTSYVAKADLKSIPLFGAWGRLMRCLFFDRDDARASVRMIQEGVAYLKEDTSVFIFPEGTRNKNAEQLPLLPFHDGSFKLAIRSNRPVIPIAISGTMEIWEAHMPWVRKTAVTLTYGKPVRIGDLPAEERKHIGEYMKNLLEEMLRNS